MRKSKRNRQTETDSAYFLKLVLYLIIGSQWLFLTDAAMTRQVPLPIGLVIGLLFTTHEHFKTDKRSEYLLLILATFVGYWAQVGVVFNILK